MSALTNTRQPQRRRRREEEVMPSASGAQCGRGSGGREVQRGVQTSFPRGLVRRGGPSEASTARQQRALQNESDIKERARSRLISSSKNAFLSLSFSLSKASLRGVRLSKRRCGDINPRCHRPPTHWCLCKFLWSSLCSKIGCPSLPRIDQRSREKRPR